MIGFGPYEPDKATDPGAAALVVNAIPVADHEVGIAWRFMPSFVTPAVASALPGVQRGAISFKNPASGVYEVYAWTSSSFYKLDSVYAWTLISTGYTLPPGDDWSMVLFGDYLIFTNTFDGMLQYNVRTPAGVAAVPGAPKARQIFVYADCVFALDCDGDNRMMRNSGINDQTQWVGGINGAGRQPMLDGQELIGGRAIHDNEAIVCQRDKTRILSRTGTRQIYAMTTLSENVGCSSARSIVVFGGVLYCLSTNGFVALSSDGPREIGEQRVNRTFRADALSTDYWKVQGAFDPVNRLVVWAYQDTGAAADQLRHGFAYSIDLDTWFKLDNTIEGTANYVAGVFQFATPGIGLDAMDVYGPLDSILIALDDRYWMGGEPLLAGIGSDGKVVFASGTTNSQTELETPPLVLDANQTLTSFTPVGDITGNFIVSAAVSSGAAYAKTQTSTKQTSGRVMTRIGGKKLKIKADPTAAWTFLRGIGETVFGAGRGVR